MERKYLKPLSLTWWSAIAALVAGLILATEPLHHWAAIAETLRQMTDLRPAELIALGTFGIGLRGAPGVSLPKGL